MNNEENNKFKNEESLNNFNKGAFKSFSNSKSNENFSYNENELNDNEESNIYNLQSNEYNNENSPNNFNESFNDEKKSKEQRKKFDKPLRIFGGLCISIGIVAFVFSSNTAIDKSTSAQNALANKVSTATSAGTILLDKDENTEAKDYQISHNSNSKESKIWIWDYAAEDGDYVQVLVDGNPVGDGFMIRHKPREITVTSVGNVQIKGIKDGGGGITYAVRYDINGTSYFNSTPQGELNTYTLVKE